MTIFGDSGGTYIETTVDGSSGYGGVLSIGGKDPCGTGTLLVDFGISRGDSVSFSRCIDGSSYLYTYGKDPGGFTATLLSFMKTCTGADSNAVRSQLDLYSDGRLSRLGPRSSLSIGGAFLQGYPIKQSISLQRVDVGIISTTYDFTLINEDSYVK